MTASNALDPQAPEGTNPITRHYVVRCDVSGQDGNTSRRYVPLAELGLWSYTIQHRHQLTIHNAAAGMWLPGAELSRHPELFSRAGNADQVDRLDLELFDADLGLCHFITRFAHQADAASVLARLTSRLPPTSFEPRQTAGQFIVRKEIDNLRQLTHPMDWAELSGPTSRAAEG